VSAHGGDIDVVLWAVHALMAALFVGWGTYFVWVLVRFRARRQPGARPAGGAGVIGGTEVPPYAGREAKGRVALATEVGVVVAEVVLLVGIALPIWFGQTSDSARPHDHEATVVRVVAEQFNWNIHYPGADGRFGDTSVALVSPANPIGLDRRSPSGADDIVLVNQLHVPVNRPVVIQLSSKDVIHSFGIHAMRVKQDATPGVPASVWFTPTTEGTFDIACSQLCGLAHYRMRAQLIVQSESAFKAFLATEAGR
jgi:cytochrome c oxidase subunit 2